MKNLFFVIAITFVSNTVLAQDIPTYVEGSATPDLRSGTVKWRDMYVSLEMVSDKTTTGQILLPLPPTRPQGWLYNTPAGTIDNGLIAANYPSLTEATGFILKAIRISENQFDIRVESKTYRLKGVPQDNNAIWYKPGTSTLKEGLVYKARIEMTNTGPYIMN